MAITQIRWEVQKCSLCFSYRYFRNCSFCFQLLVLFFWEVFFCLLQTKNKKTTHTLLSAFGSPSWYLTPTFAVSLIDWLVGWLDCLFLGSLSPSNCKTRFLGSLLLILKLFVNTWNCSRTKAMRKRCMKNPGLCHLSGDHEVLSSSYIGAWERGPCMRAIIHGCDLWRP